MSFDLQASLSAEKHPDPATTPHPLQSRPLQPPSRGLRGLRWPGWQFWIVAASTLLLLMSIVGWIMLAVRVSNREHIPTTPVRFDVSRQPESAAGRPATSIDQPVGGY